MASRDLKTWNARHWALAAALPFALFVLEAVKLVLFPETRGGNLSLAAQLGLFAAFYMSWTVVPRAIHVVLVRTGWATGERRWAGLVALFALGLAASVVHLTMLAAILRAIYAPQGGGWMALLYAATEVWVARGGFWFLAFGLAAVLIGRRAADRVKDRPPTVIEVRHKGNLMALKPDEVSCLMADGNYARIVSSRGVFNVRGTLSFWEEKLGTGFFRAHRSALVNVRKVQLIRKQDHGTGFVVHLQDGCEAPLSRRRVDALRAEWRAEARA